MIVVDVILALFFLLGFWFVSNLIFAVFVRYALGLKVDYLHIMKVGPFALNELSKQGREL